MHGGLSIFNMHLLCSDVAMVDERARDEVEWWLVDLKVAGRCRRPGCLLAIVASETGCLAALGLPCMMDCGFENLVCVTIILCCQLR